LHVEGEMETFAAESRLEEILVEEAVAPEVEST
jgi:hypothetical protein